MSSFWSAWIILLTTLTLTGCVWLLLGNRRTSDQETTGHVFDGIEEYENPMPAWWLWGFMISIVFGVIYLLLYPGLGNFKGVLGWSQQSRYEAEVARANEKFGPIYQRYAAMSIEDVADDKAAMRMAGRLFGDNCAQCHGADARGSRGYPDLSNGVWQWGGEPEQIKHSINSGRQAAMPPWQAVLGDLGVGQTAEYLLQINGKSAERGMAAAGKNLYTTYCAACHGAGAEGNALLGAPALNDDIWLYGGSRQAIRESIAAGRSGVMPAQKDFLYPEKIHLLAAYVYGLSDE